MSDSISSSILEVLKDLFSGPVANTIVVMPVAMFGLWLMFQAQKDRRKMEQSGINTFEIPDYFVRGPVYETMMVIKDVSRYLHDQNDIMNDLVEAVKDVGKNQQEHLRAQSIQNKILEEIFDELKLRPDSRSRTR